MLLFFGPDASVGTRRYKPLNVGDKITLLNCLIRPKIAILFYMYQRSILRTTATSPHRLYHISIYVYIFWNYIFENIICWKHIPNDKWFISGICLHVMELNGFQSDFHDLPSMHSVEQNTEMYEVWCNIRSVVNNVSANGLSPRPQAFTCTSIDALSIRHLEQTSIQF